MMRGANSGFLTARFPLTAIRFANQERPSAEAKTDRDEDSVVQQSGKPSSVNQTIPWFPIPTERENQPLSELFHFGFSRSRIPPTPYPRPTAREEQTRNRVANSSRRHVSGFHPNRGHFHHFARPPFSQSSRYRSNRLEDRVLSAALVHSPQVLGAGGRTFAPSQV